MLPLNCGVFANNLKVDILCYVVMCRVMAAKCGICVGLSKSQGKRMKRNDEVLFVYLVV